jgi:hypothetical protein
MKKILGLSAFLIIALFSNAQIGIKPGMSAVYTQQSQLFGYVISNDLFYIDDKSTFVFGFDLLNAFGNKNIQWENSEFKYSFIGFNYHPADHINNSSILKFPVQLIKPFTSSSRHITLRIEYNTQLNLKKIEFQAGVGFFGSHVDTYYYLESFKKSDLFFYGTSTPILDDVNIVLPVFLRYYNFGLTLYMNIPLFESKRLPIDFTMRYQLGMHKTGIFSMGFSKKLIPKLNL